MPIRLGHAGRGWPRIMIVAVLAITGLAAVSLPAAASPVAAIQHRPGQLMMMAKAHVSVLHYSVSVRHGITTVRASGPTVITVRGQRPITLRRAGVVRVRSGPATRPSVDYVCTLGASIGWSDPGYVVEASGSQTCSGSGWSPQRVRVAVQWYLGMGLWSNRARDGSSFANGNHSYVAWNTYYDCGGTGTHTYRAAVDGYTDGNNNVRATEDSGGDVGVCK
jgi:hypothetical protein